jgi:hypothetical protein
MVKLYYLSLCVVLGSYLIHSVNFNFNAVCVNTPQQNMKINFVELSTFNTSTVDPI